MIFGAGDEVILCGLGGTNKELNWQAALIVKQCDDGKWLVRVEGMRKDFAVSQKNLHRLDSNGVNHADQSELKSETRRLSSMNVALNEKKLVIHGLSTDPIFYKNSSWLDSSKLNGFRGVPKRTEGSFIILRLDDGSEFPVRLCNLETAVDRQFFGRPDQDTISQRDHDSAEGELQSVLDVRHRIDDIWQPRFCILTPAGQFSMFATSDDAQWGSPLETVSVARTVEVGGAETSVSLVRDRGPDPGDPIGRLVLELRVQQAVHSCVFLLATTSPARHAAWLRGLACATRTTRAAPLHPAKPPLAPAGQSFSARNFLAASPRPAGAPGGPSGSFSRRSSDAGDLGTEAAQQGVEGYVEKRGYWSRAWRRRYLVLTPEGRLDAYPDLARARAGPPRRSLPVSPAGNALSAVVRAKGSDQGRHLLEVEVKAGPARGELWVFGLATAAERDRWLRTLLAAAAPPRPRPKASTSPVPAPARRGSRLEGGRPGESTTPALRRLEGGRPRAAAASSWERDKGFGGSLGRRDLRGGSARSRCG